MLLEIDLIPSPENHQYHATLLALSVLHTFTSPSSLQSSTAAIAREEPAVQRRLRIEGRHRHGLLLRL